MAFTKGTFNKLMELYLSKMASNVFQAEVGSPTRMMNKKGLLSHSTEGIESLLGREFPLESEFHLQRELPKSIKRKAESQTHHNSK